MYKLMTLRNLENQTFWIAARRCSSSAVAAASASDENVGWCVLLWLTQEKIVYLPWCCRLAENLHCRTRFQSHLQW